MNMLNLYERNINKNSPILNMEAAKIVLDEFVQFVKENDLTGFDFVEIYDSENFISADDTIEDAKAPAEEITTSNRRNITMGNQIIPMAHEDGIFAPCDLNMQTNECLEVLS